MARIFITGSSDGLGQMAASVLVNQGHDVVVHARNADRAAQTQAKLPGAEKILTADLSSIAETKNLSEVANTMGQFDAIIHNAGVYHIASSTRTVDDLPMIFAVNSLAPYILTCLIQKPKRLIYMSSGMHLQGNRDLEGLGAEELRSGSVPTYSDSKYHDLILALTVSCKWPDVYSNALDPGWVATKMGGAGAPDSLEKGAETQAWLAVSDDVGAKVSGHYFHHKRVRDHLKQAGDIQIQEKFFSVCKELSGVEFPS